MNLRVGRVKHYRHLHIHDPGHIHIMQEQTYHRIMILVRYLHTTMHDQNHTQEHHTNGMIRVQEHIPIQEYLLLTTVVPLRITRRHPDSLLERHLHQGTNPTQVPTQRFLPTREYLHFDADTLQVLIISVVEHHHMAVVLNLRQPDHTILWVVVDFEVLMIILQHQRTLVTHMTHLLKPSSIVRFTHRRRVIHRRSHQRMIDQVQRIPVNHLLQAVPLQRILGDHLVATILLQADLLQRILEDHSVAILLHHIPKESHLTTGDPLLLTDGQ